MYWYEQAINRPGQKMNRPDLNTFADMQPHIDFILLEGLNTETDTSNLQRLLWTSAVHIYETIENNTSFAINFIRILLTQVCARGSTSWPKDVILVCFQILSDLASVVDHLGEVRREGAAVKSKDVPSWLVSTLCKFIEIHCNIQCAAEAPNDTLMVAAMNSIQLWCMTGNWIFKDRILLVQVLSTIDMFMHSKSTGTTTGGSGGASTTSSSTSSSTKGVKEYWPPSDKMKEVAQQFFINLVNHNGQFPQQGVGPSRLTALSSEADILSNAKLTSQNISCFIHNRTIMSVVRHPRSSAEEDMRVTLVLRDMSGKYVWESALKYFGTQNEGICPPEAGMNPGARSMMKGLYEPSEPPHYASTLGDFLDDTGCKSYEEIIKLATTRHSNEISLLMERSYGLDEDIHAVRPKGPPLAQELDTTPSRLFLSHLGFLSLVNRSQFHLLRSTNPSIPFNFVVGFKRVDEAKERETFSIGVLYVKDGQRTIDEVYSNIGGSQDYTDFISSVGELVKLDKHTGYSGSLSDHPENGSIAPYFADLTREVIFHVATLMPNVDTQEHKKRHINNDKAVIYWVENLKEFVKHPLYTSMDKKTAHVIVHPLQTGMYKIVIVKDPSLQVGPLLDGMLTHKVVLAALVRQTCITTLRQIRTTAGTPSTIRSFILDDFASRNKVDVSLSAFYASQFSMGPPPKSSRKKDVIKESSPKNKNKSKPEEGISGSTT